MDLKLTEETSNKRKTLAISILETATTMLVNFALACEIEKMLNYIKLENN